MYDAKNPYDHEEDAMGENVRVANADTESNGRRFQDTPPDIAITMRILVKYHEEQHKLNASMLQSLIDIQRRMSSRHRTEKPEGSKSSAKRRKRHSSGSFDSEGSTGGQRD